MRMKALGVKPSAAAPSASRFGNGKLRLSSRRADRLDCCDLRFADAIDRSDTGAHRDAIEMHGASAAQCHAAAELRAGHAQHVAQHPKQRRVAVDIDAMRLTVDFNGEGHDVLSLVHQPRILRRNAGDAAGANRIRECRSNRHNPDPFLVDDIRSIVWWHPSRLASWGLLASKIENPNHPSTHIFSNPSPLRPNPSGHPPRKSRRPPKTHASRLRTRSRWDMARLS